jgi:hydrogenase small subunit
LTLTQRESAAQVADRIGKSKPPSVIWLHFQDCTGCSETLLNSSEPDLADLIFNLISLDYHETFMAASGMQSETALRKAINAHRGEYILVIEGSIPTGQHGQYMKVGGRPALEVLPELASQAALIIAMGSCASWGGLPAADPDPTGAVGVQEIIKDKRIINLPGCPPNIYSFLSVVLEYASMHRLPALDTEGRPRFAYDRLIHDHCPRRGHFDAGRFAQAYGDEQHRQGWCLYKLGCKGPVTHAPCSTLAFNDVPDAWPIGIGAPCAGCTERDVAFRIPLFKTVGIHGATPPDVFPAVNTSQGVAKTAAVALVGVIAGATGAAIAMASRRLPGAEPAHVDVASIDKNSPHRHNSDLGGE